MDLDQAKPVFPVRAVEDHEDVVLEVVELRPLAELLRVLDGERVDPEQLGDQLDVLMARRDEVEPEELVAVA